MSKRDQQMTEGENITRRTFLTGAGVLAVAGLPAAPSKAARPHGIDTSEEARAHAIQTMWETDNGRKLPFETREQIRKLAGFGPLER